MPRPSVKQQIIDAGLAELHARGYAACSVEDITKGAGVPKGSFYNHFPSKEAFAVEAVRRYVFIYTGGEKAAPQEDWISWLRGLGDSVAEAGHPFFGESATVNSSGVTSGGASKAGGYTIVNADSIDDATAMAKGCPIVPSGGNVEVYEASDM